MRPAASGGPYSSVFTSLKREAVDVGVLVAEQAVLTLEALRDEPPNTTSDSMALRSEIFVRLFSSAKDLRATRAFLSSAGEYSSAWIGLSPIDSSRRV